MECYKEEIFGPVLVILNADTLDDVSSLLFFVIKSDNLWYTQEYSFGWMRLA